MRERDLFIEALEIDDPTDRAKLLDEACKSDADLRARVERLLTEHERQESFFLDSPPMGVDATADQPIHERPGAVIGPYKLLQQIGEGGMGVVFMAEQTVPLKRTVALKIIKPGMDSRQVIARFEAERQALAMMDHPNIAKVLDAGTTESGRPYFVMELVKGVPITTYCDERRLSVRERLELFIVVCQAVQHAHQKGIIHRDIKPSNVLVAEYDEHAVPKVIDFGVAKASTQKLTERTMFTEFGQMIGTVEYMSPEQAKLNQLDIDTRSDIYSLGVLLYELLTGTTPFEVKRLREAAFDEMLRIIREEEPERPSTRLSSSVTLPSISANRHSEPARLSKEVHGELDWIVMKTLEKDRSRRYATANSLASDLIFYLNDEAVLACPPTTIYRFRKFARRNKAALVVGLTLGVAIMIAMAGLVVNNRRVTREKDQKEAALANALKEKQRADQNLIRARQAVNKYLILATNNPLLKEADFYELRRNLLESSVPFYQEFVEQKPDDANLEAERGRAYGDLALVREELGELEQALKNHAQRLIIFERLVADFPSDPRYRQELANSFRSAGTVHLDLNQFAEAEPAFRQAAKVLESLTHEHPSHAPYRQDLAGVYNNLSVLLRQMDRQDEALKAQQQAVTLREQLANQFADSAEYRFDLAASLSNLSSVFHDLGQHEESLAANQHAVVAFEKLAEEHPNLPRYQEMWGGSLDNRAVLLCESGRTEQGLAALQKALHIIEKLAADFPSAPSYRYGLATSLLNLSILQSEMGQIDQGLATCERAIGKLEELSRESPNVVIFQQVLAGAYHSQKELLRKSNQLERALVSSRKSLGLQEKLASGHPSAPQLRADLARTHIGVGEILNQLGRYDESAAAYDKALPINEQLARDFPAVVEYAVRLAATYGSIGDLKLSQQEHNAALAWYDKALSTLAPALSSEPRLAAAQRDAILFNSNRAVALSELGRHAEALEDLDRALAIDGIEDRIALRCQRAKTMAHLQMHAQAISEAEDIGEAPDLSAKQLLEIANIYAICAGKELEDPQLYERYAARAVELLRRAIEQGDQTVKESVATDANLDALRARDDFQQLMKAAELEPSVSEIDEDE